MLFLKSLHTILRFYKKFRKKFTKVTSHTSSIMISLITLNFLINFENFIKTTFVDKAVYLYSIKSKTQLNLNDFQI